MARRLFPYLVFALVFLAACHARIPPTQTPVPASTATATRPPPPTRTPTPTPLPLLAWVERTLSLDRFHPQGALVVRFSQEMDAGSAAQPLTFSSPLPGRFKWDRDRTRLDFHPSGGFTPGQTYTVTLGAELKSAGGRSFDEPPHWTINVLPAPQVIEHPTTAGQTGTGRRPTMRLAFDREMDRESVAAALRVVPDVPLVLDWRDETLYLTPARSLDPGTAYAFALTRTATDRAGVRLASPVEWTYDLQDLICFLTPPANGNQNAPVVITFNYPMDPASVRDALRFEPATAGELSWNEARTEFIFTPAARLPSDASYVLHLEGRLRDAHGDDLPALDPIAFITPPPILDHQPQGTTVHPVTAIEIAFDRPMDEALTSAAFQIRPDVRGSLEWRDTTLVFQPEDGYLAENTRYDVALSTAARDAHGGPVLRQAFTWSFHTGELTDLASFGWGPNAQVLDVDGRRAVQFMLMEDRRAHRASHDIVFELYRLNQEQFLDRYASGFRGVAGTEKRPIRTQDTSLVATWQLETTGTTLQPEGLRETLVPEDIPPGLYVLNLVAGRLNDQLILVVTRNALVVKQAEGQLVAWVTDIAGRPRPGIAVQVYARDGTLIDSGHADGRGVYRTRIDRDPQPLIVIARDGGDVTASGLSDEWRGDGGWWNWWRPAPAALRYAAHIYTERPIYRPGQTVSFKAILRRDEDALLSPLPAGTAITARIRDARNNVVQTLPLTANPLGTVHGAFELAEGAMLGQYAVEIVVEGESHGQVFKVEDYRKPDYEVHVLPDAGRYVDGETILVTVDSQYFTGEPVAGAEVVIERFNLEPYYGWGREESEYAWYPGPERTIRGKTDENGRFSFTLNAKSQQYGGVHWGNNLRQDTWAVQATVDDGSRQTVSDYAVIQVFDAGVKLHLDTDGYAKLPGQTFTVRARATTIDDEPVPGQHLRLELRRYSPSSHGYNTIARSAESTTDGQGQAQIPFAIDEPGHYQLRLSGADRQGNPLEYTQWICAFSNVSARWHGRGDALRVDADRDRYAPGDVARLLVESTFDGPALLTFERGTTRREQLLELLAPVTLVEVPVQADDAPNVFVTIHAWQAQEATPGEPMYESLADSRLYVASVELVVPVTDKMLDVTIAPDRPAYQPREQATIRLRVTDASGRPVSAEVSLAMVDEAIYALSDELAGPIHDAFYRRREHIVRTYDSMAPRRYLGGGGGGGGGALAGNPRKDFPDTARWWPALYTDANGEVVVSLTLPDSLTRWRLTAVAVTADTQVGETSVTVVTRQDVVVRPILPRSLTAGDRVELSAIVLNHSDHPQDLDVSISAGGILELQDPIVQTVRLAAGESRQVVWQAAAAQPGETEVLVRANAGGEIRDAVALRLPVRPLAIPDVTNHVGHFDDAFAVDLDLPEGALPTSSVRVELARSIAGSMLEGLEYLTGFPYGCVEQTMSKALPNAVVGRALRRLGVSDPTLLADLPAQINAGLQRLYGFQHNDGGWGWWYDDSTDAYQTAWVVFGLAMTADAGYEVDEEVIERGAQWLAENLGTMDVRTRAYALYSIAVAGHGDLAVTRGLVERLHELDTFGRAALALALHELGATGEAQAVMDALIESATQRGDTVAWTGAADDGYYQRKTMASSVRSTALALSAMIRVRPRHELEPGVVRWLMGQRREHGWGTTNETSYALLALTDHLLAAQDATTETRYRVMLNGDPFASGRLGPGEPAVRLEIPAHAMHPGANRLHIEQEGGGRLYYVVSSRIYLAQERIEPAGAIAVSRTYLDARTRKPVTKVAPGQLVEVHLAVHMPDRGAYILLEDHLPGGLEALNERLNTSSHIARGHQEPPAHWREYGYNHKEVHGDRVTFFITEMEGGKRTFTYLARATHAGQFVAMPTQVSAMYDLTTWGRSESDTLPIEPPQAE